MQHDSPAEPGISRRALLKSAGVAVAGATAGCAVLGAGAAEPPATNAPKSSGDRATYQTHAKGIRIFPGQWRPHYTWEQIVWISPSWPSQDYLWLDFPEALFTCAART